MAAEFQPDYQPPATPAEFRTARSSARTAMWISAGILLFFWLVIFTSIDIIWPGR